MPKKFRITILTAIIACSSCLHGQVRIPRPAPVPKSVKVPPGGVAVPMLDLGGRPVVELRINGKGPFPFLLDTGAGVTAVSEDLSRELSLSAPADMQMRAVAGSDGAPPPMVAIHEIRLGDAVIEGIVAMMMPSGALRVGGNAPRGVLAASAFWGYLLTYDYPGKRILIKKGSLAEADSKSIFQYNKDQLLPMIPVRIAGHDTQVDLDTGSPHGLTLPTRFLAELPLATQPKTVGKAHTPNGTEFTVSVARVDGTIELGRYKLETDEVHFSDIRPGPFPPNGNIGYQVLRHFVVTLDCKNRRIQLEQ